MQDLTAIGGVGSGRGLGLSKGLFYFCFLLEARIG
jgi:hypothetical protein